MSQQVKVYRELQFYMSGQVVNAADFTDGGGTSGYIDLTKKLPAGAIPLGFKAVVQTGFTGSSQTTAVIQVGVSGDTDRFSLNTDGSVYAAGTVGSLPATDACAGIAAAQTIRVTVTASGDFTAVKTAAAGKMRVIVYYIWTK